MESNSNLMKSNIDIETKDYNVSDDDQKKYKATNDKENTMIAVTFTCIGLSTLNVWNTALGLNINLRYNAFQMTGLVFSSIAALFIDVPKYFLPYFLGALAVLSAGFQITHRILSESQFGYYCIFSFVIIGIVAGLAQTTAFSIASTLKENMTGYISAGLGLSGIIIFLINLLLDQIVSTDKRFDINTDKLLYLYFICEIFLCISIVLVVLNLNISKQKIKKDEVSQERSLSYKEILKDSYKSIICAFFVNWLTLQLFPGVGHKKWQESHDISDSNVTIIVGMFQVFDFISRYTPNLTHIKFFRFFTFSLNKLIIANLLRLLFIPWFILNSAVDSSFFANIVQQSICMSLFAFTNGWLNTVPFMVFIKELKVVKSSKDIEMVSTFMVMAMFIGLFTGIWTSYFYNIFPIVIT